MPGKGMLIFDLDGTLTIPVLDFDAIRCEIGLPPGPILESMERLAPSERERAWEIIHAHEEHAAHHAELQPRAQETVATLRKSGWPVGILTRNARQWADIILAKHAIEIDILFTREDEPIKPSPEPILRMCARLDCDPTQSWMIGDHLFDIQAGQRAGCKTVLMIGSLEPPDDVDDVDYVVRRIDDLLSLVEC